VELRPLAKVSPTKLQPCKKHKKFPLSAMFKDFSNSARGGLQDCSGVCFRYDINAKKAQLLLEVSLPCLLACNQRQPEVRCEQLRDAHQPQPSVVAYPIPTGLNTKLAKSNKFQLTESLMLTSHFEAMMFSTATK
jgi:hypothetical protein